MIFEGIEPWEAKVPLVEIQKEGRIIDLHNSASFIGFEYRHPETLIVTFDYDEREGGLHSGWGSRLVRLHFEGVRNLLVTYEELEAVYEGDTLSDFIYWGDFAEQRAVEITFMDGLQLQFDAGSVKVTVS